MSSSSAPKYNQSSSTQHLSEEPVIPDQYEAGVQKKFEKWTRTLKLITGIGLTELEKEEFRAKQQKDLENKACKRCEKWRDHLMERSENKVSVQPCCNLIWLHLIRQVILTWVSSMSTLLNKNRLNILKNCLMNRPSCGV